MRTRLLTRHAPQTLLHIRPTKYEGIALNFDVRLSITNFIKSIVVNIALITINNCQVTTKRTRDIPFSADRRTPLRGLSSRP
jgi:hypothetical protein